MPRVPGTLNLERCFKSEARSTQGQMEVKG